MHTHGHYVYLEVEVFLWIWTSAIWQKQQLTPVCPYSQWNGVFSMPKWCCYKTPGICEKYFCAGRISAVQNQVLKPQSVLLNNPSVINRLNIRINKLIWTVLYSLSCLSISISSICLSLFLPVCFFFFICACLSYHSCLALDLPLPLSLPHTLLSAHLSITNLCATQFN